MGKERNTINKNRHIKLEAFSYHFKQEEPRNSSSIETAKLLTV